MPVDEQDQEEQQRRRYQQALAENGQNPYEGEGPQQEVRSADNSPNNGVPPPPVPSGEGQAPYEGEGPPAQQPQPPSTPKQPRSAQYMEGINQALGSPPIPPKNNALQAIGRTILQMNPRLAPHADEILHPKFSAEQRQYGARMNDYAERQKLAENQLRNDSLADQREATAQYRKLTAQNAADQRKEQRFQHDTEILYRGGQLIPVDAPVPQGFSVIPAPFSPGMQYAIKPNASTEDVELTPELARFGKLAPGTRVSHDLYLKLVTAAAQSQGRVDAINAKPIPPVRPTAAQGQYMTAQQAYRDLTSMDPTVAAGARAWLNRNMSTPLGSVKITGENGMDSVQTVPRSAPPPIPRAGDAMPTVPQSPQNRPTQQPGQSANPQARMASWSDISNASPSDVNGLHRISFTPTQQESTPMLAASAARMQRISPSSVGPVAIAADTPQALAQQKVMVGLVDRIRRAVEDNKDRDTAFQRAISMYTGKRKSYMGEQLEAYMREHGSWDAIGTPLTSQNRTMKEAAITLLPHVGEIESLIEKLDKEGQLGPISGRFNKFLTGQIGSENNADYAKLRGELKFFTTAMMRAHVGARGGIGLMTGFQELWDSGKMNGENLRQGLESARSFLDGYAKMGDPHPHQPQDLKGLSTDQLFQMLTKGK